MTLIFLKFKSDFSLVIMYISLKVPTYTNESILELVGTYVKNDFQFYSDNAFTKYELMSYNYQYDCFITKPKPFKGRGGGGGYKYPVERT